MQVMHKNDSIFLQPKKPILQSLRVYNSWKPWSTETTNLPQERALLGVLFTLMYYTFCASSEV
jgi:hypothetical protein